MKAFDNSILNNTEQHRFEIQKDGFTSELVYKISDNKLYLLHTWVPETLEGQGIGTALAEYALWFVLENQLKLIAICPFVRAYMNKNPNWPQELNKNE
jgi:hypothetical protein